MIITLEDYLVQLHSGQWFGFNGEHIYDNLVIHSDEFAKPTEKECVDGVAKLQAEWDSKEYTRKRKTEYPSIEDVTVALAEKAEGNSTMWDEITLKRQAIKAKYPKE